MTDPGGATLENLNRLISEVTTPDFQLRTNNGALVAQLQDVLSKYMKTPPMFVFLSQIDYFLLFSQPLSRINSGACQIHTPCPFSQSTSAILAAFHHIA